MTEKFAVQEYRDLTGSEQTLLEWLVNHSDRAKAYSDQIKKVHVASHCTCGCPTIYLALGTDQISKTGPSKIIADAEGKSPEGVPVGVILHVRDDELSELEIYSMDGTANFGLPAPSGLQLI